MPVIIGCLVLPILLLIVIVLGIVASIAIPGLAAARMQARDAAARTELDSVMIAQEQYAVEHGVYAGTLADLEFADDPEVTTTILWGSEAGYAICSRHPDSPMGWRVDSDRFMVERATGEC